MSIYDFQYKLHMSDGTPVDMSDYRGSVLLIVNTASRCSYSRQFAGLQRLYDSYRAQGFKLLAFPCNQFNEKEPGSDVDIRQYCESNFGLTFPFFAKTEVRGPKAHPLFRELSAQAPFQGFDPVTPNAQWMQEFLETKHPDIYANDGVKWNFSKFLLDRNGMVKARFETTVEPEAIAPHIEALL
ncbi:UNVERIFIED_CONTAM: glutathione peroxidase [Brevibacillus sp. OAP136]